MKSKTRRTSKSSAPKQKRAKPLASSSEAAQELALAVGHEPTGQLQPQDEKLFRAFQSNLLSLISHELRTPLMGILNSLMLLDEGGEAGISHEELVKMARQNADRLHRTLAALLDLAQLESGVFHARLREIDFGKLLRVRLDAVSKKFRAEDLKTDLKLSARVLTILADAQKVSRAVDLCLHAILSRAEPQSTIQITAGEAEVEFRFRMRHDVLSAWKQAWLQAEAGFQGGVASPSSAFGGVLQSEEAFLTRQEEGLGSELSLIHEIMRLHKGKFTQRSEGADEGSGLIALVLSFSPLSSEQAVRAVLTSRAYDVSTELGSVALVLLEKPGFKANDKEFGRFADNLRKQLFRATDAVYPLPDRHQIALVLDDCKAEDVPGLLGRLKKGLPADGGKLALGWAHCPSDSLDPGKLFDLAAEALTRS